MHVPVTVSQAIPTGQSLAVAQMQAPPLPEATHITSASSLGQAAHIVPPLPHAAEARPFAQLLPAQQPPLQGCIAEHCVVQAPLAISQACPVGQPVDEAQPTSTEASRSSAAVSRAASVAVESIDESALASTGAA